MEMLKLLNEAKASGLSKEEFFHLINLEIKLNESKTTGVVDHEKLLQDMSNKFENQQLKQLEILQQIVKDLFEQQKKQLYQQLHDLQEQLQHQQESQNEHIQQIQKQLQQELEIQQVQQSINKDLHIQHQKQQPQQQSRENQHYIHEKIEQVGTNPKKFEQMVQEMKDQFYEMRITILNRLEEEKGFMRNALSKAQNEILSLLSNTKEDLKKMKEIMEKDVVIGLEKQTEQLLKFCEEMLQPQYKMYTVPHEHIGGATDNGERGSCNMLDPYNSEQEFESPF